MSLENKIKQLLTEENYKQTSHDQLIGEEFVYDPMAEIRKQVLEGLGVAADKIREMREKQKRGIYINLEKVLGLLVEKEE